MTFALIILSFSLVANNVPMKPVELKKNYLEPKSLEFVEYGSVPVFAENLRFNHNLISYDISNSCDNKRREEAVSAFNIFSEETKVISFYEVGKNGEIKVKCSNEFIQLNGDLFAAGEGGPSRIINTSGFKVIEEGRIVLYNAEDCDYPIVALHELCHVFGFDHSPDPDNIMYNTSSCHQRMSPDMGEFIQELYSIEPLADAKIEDVEGVVRGKYLDFNISVLNEGMMPIVDIYLGIYGDGKFIDSVEMGDIDIGYGRTLKVENMPINLGIKDIKFIIDFNEVVRELSEENNEATLSVVQQSLKIN